MIQRRKRMKRKTTSAPIKTERASKRHQIIKRGSIKKLVVKQNGKKLLMKKEKAKQLISSRKIQLMRYLNEQKLFLFV
jgi:hypothetical protein